MFHSKGQRVTYLQLMDISIIALLYGEMKFKYEFSATTISDIRAVNILKTNKFQFFF
jgi:hypothetical protein